LLWLERGHATAETGREDRGRGGEEMQERDGRGERGKNGGNGENRDETQVREGVRDLFRGGIERVAKRVKFALRA